MRKRCRPSRPARPSKMCKCVNLARLRTKMCKCVNLARLAMKNCWPQASKVDGRTVFCTDVNSWRVFEADVNSDTKTIVPGLQGRGFVMLPRQERLIYSRAIGTLFPVPHEKTVTVVFDLENHSECVLVGESLVHPDRAVWIPD
jgi:hypothetical protein